MEERRLKTILSHLSPAVASNSATCDVLKNNNKRGPGDDRIGDKWNLPIAVHEDLRLLPHCAKSLNLLARSRNVARAVMPEHTSSFARCEDERSSSKEKSIREEKNTDANGVDGRLKDKTGRIHNNSFLHCSPSTWPITGNEFRRTSQPLKAFSSLVDCDSVPNELTTERCRGVPGTNLRVNDFEYQFRGATEGGAGTSETKEFFGSVRSEKSDHREHHELACLADIRLETQQLEGSNRNEPAAEARTLAPPFGEAQPLLTQECELNSVVELTHLDTRVREESASSSSVQRAVNKQDTLPAQMSKTNRESAGESQPSQHQVTLPDLQADKVTREIFNTLAKQDQQTAIFRSSKSRVKAADCKSEAGGTVNLSRNNAMTGQRRSMTEDCIFCRIVEGRSPAFKLYEDEMCVCILDVHPLSHGHSLIIPKAHFRSLELTPPEVAAAMCAVVPVISHAIMEATTCDSFNLLVNSGKAAGQVVFHTHFHIIPRTLGDNLWRSEDSSRGPLPLGHETSLLVKQIRHKLSGKLM